MRRKVIIAVGAVAALALLLAFVAFLLSRRARTEFVWSGVVTTDDVVVSPPTRGQLSRLLVAEGDTVTRGQVVAVIRHSESRTGRSRRTTPTRRSRAQAARDDTALREQEKEAEERVQQAEASLTTVVWQQAAAQEALEKSRLAREQTLRRSRTGAASAEDLEQADSAYRAALDRETAALERVNVQRAALARARSDAEQAASQRKELAARQRRLAAADARRPRAGVRPSDTEIHAPIDGIVGATTAEVGAAVEPDEAVLRLIDPDDLWVRVDVEAEHIDHIRIGQELTVRLPTGAELPGSVLDRGVGAELAPPPDAGPSAPATRTFPVRVRVDDPDGLLDLGMTADVLLEVSPE